MAQEMEAVMKIKVRSKPLKNKNLLIPSLEPVPLSYLMALKLDVHLTKHQGHRGLPGLETDV